MVNFGDSLPEREVEEAWQHSRQSDLFIVLGSSLVVTPAADMPQYALDNGGRLVIVNKGETPYDDRAHLRSWVGIGEIFPQAVELALGDAD